MSQQKENNPDIRNEQIEITQSLGRKIKSCREQNHMSQEELAEQLSVTRQAVSNWERDKTLPDVYTLRHIAEVFDMTLDDFMEHTREAEVTMPKMPGYLALLSVAAILLYLIVGGITSHLMVELVIEMVIIGIFCQLFLHLYFSSAVKSGNFSMLAGYDSKVEYNVNEVKKVLVQIDNHISCSSFAMILLLFASAFAEKKQMEVMSVCVILIYCVEFTAVIMFYNYRNIDKTMIKEIDRKTAKAGNISLNWFVAWIFVFVGVTIAKFEVYSIENNSIRSIGYMGWMFLFLIVTMAELFYEQHRVKEKIKKTGSYRPGKAFWISSVLAAAITVLMFFK